MASAGRKSRLYCFAFNSVLKISTVGAMFYISPTLTLLMLSVVPPVVLGAVCTLLVPIFASKSLAIPGRIREVPQETVKSDPGISR